MYFQKRYYRILRQQIDGDLTQSKFPYYEQMHRILIQESDPTCLRNQRYL